MPSKETVITPTEPTLGNRGAAEVPDSIKFDDKLIHTPKVESEELNNMLRSDGQVGGLYRILTTPLRGAKILVVPKKIGNRTGNREANFIREVLTYPYAEGGMTIPLQTVMSTVLRMLIDGWSPHEIVWEIREQQVRVEKIEYRPVHSVTPQIDDRNNLVGYKQDLNKVRKGISNRGTTGLDGEIIIPEDKVLHFVNGPEWNYIFGRSIFMQAYHHFDSKHKLYYIAHIAAQINALRMKIVKVPDEKKDKADEYLDLVAKLGFNSTISLPSDVIVELLDETSHTFPDISPLIQHHDSQMSKSVLAQVLDIGVDSSTGSFNLSDTHLDVFIANLELMAQYIASIFNFSLIPKLIDWNFGTKNYPRVQFQPFDRLVKKQLFEMFTRISAAPTVNVSPEFLTEMEKEIAETIGLNIDYEAISDNVTEMNRKQRMAQMQKQQGGETGQSVGDPDTRDRTTRTQ